MKKIINLIYKKQNLKNKNNNKYKKLKISNNKKLRELNK